MQSSSLVLVGVIATSHGVRGQVKLRSFTAIAEDIADYPLTDKTGNRHFNITITSHTKDALIASIEGIVSKEEADALRATELYVARSALPKLDANEFYQNDLIGMTIKREDGGIFGTVKAFHNFGAGTMIEIAHEDGDTELLPFSKTTFPHIDTTNKTIIIHPPEYITQEPQE